MSWIAIELVMYGFASVLAIMLGLNLMALASFWTRTKAWQRATEARSTRRSGE